MKSKHATACAFVVSLLAAAVSGGRSNAQLPRSELVTAAHGKVK